MSDGQFSEDPMKKGLSNEPEVFEQVDASGEPGSQANGGPPDGAENGASVLMPGGGAYPDDMFTVQTNGASAADAMAGPVTTAPNIDGDAVATEPQLPMDPELEPPTDPELEIPAESAPEEDDSTARESFAPPGMQDRAAGGIVIADSGGSKKAASGSAGKKRIRFGLKKKA